jgi:hypothetical protein
MPRDLAPALRSIVFWTACIGGILITFFIKGGAMRGAGLVAVLGVLIVVCIVGFGAMAWTESRHAEDLKLPNPLHPDNRPKDGAAE